MAAVRISVEEIGGYFRELEDPRSTINRKHPFVSVLVIAIMAVLAGANGPTAIARWAKMKKEFLTGVLDLPSGIPCKDVFRRVLGLVKPAAFQACFMTWLTSLRAAAAAAADQANQADQAGQAGQARAEQPIFAVDGKRRCVAATTPRMDWGRCTR